MARFTKQQRQEIIRDFCLRRNREFDAKLFAKEVRETGPSHPAYGWFQWDDDRAAEEYRIWQAREFSRGLKVSFSIEEVGRSGTVKVREVQAPMLVSPMSERRSGGGYFLTDPENPQHMAELCEQAAIDLGRWLKRYEAAILHAGGSVAAIRKQIAALERAAPVEEDEAA